MSHERTPEGDFAEDEHTTTDAQDAHQREELRRQLEREMNRFEGGIEG